MKRLAPHDGNLFGIIDGRCLDAGQVPYPYEEHSTMRALQMHTSLLKRLHLEKELEGHGGCVNALAWNSAGSLLLSGSDDTRVNVWDYGSNRLAHSIDTGHTANIFCTKFMPETGDDLVVSGAGDCEVRLHRLSRQNGEPLAVFRCHSKRVKKLAVEDGNPHVTWSASEDGTLRQHDLRESVSCGTSEQECRNILLDLRSAGKKSLADTGGYSFALKTCAISRTRSHQLLVGGSDSFARLYDRRMLPPQQMGAPPRCVCYYCPAHLSEYARPTLHLTHVTFSPDGEEVLLSYSGEHVYLMDTYNGQDPSVVYTASDLPKRIALSPVLNGVQVPAPRCEQPSRPEYHKLFAAAKVASEEEDYFNAIECASEVIDAGGTSVGTSLRHDCLCVRAAAFLKRGWKNDIHMAIRDSNEARRLYPTSVVAHVRMAEALSQLQKHKESLEFAWRACLLDPEDHTLAEHVTKIRANIEDAEEQARKKKDNEDDSRDRTRFRTLRELFMRPGHDQSDLTTMLSSDDSRTERDDSDAEMEMEIEMSVTPDTDRDRESGGGSSLNLRLRKRSDGGRRKESTSSRATNECDEEAVMDMRQRYVGHCNTGTDIKQASFLGERGDYIASGSDDGRWFIWEKKTGRIVKMLVGDEHVVNCVQCHPFDCTVATSGIDNTIKLWTPRSKSHRSETFVPDSEALKIMATNQEEMKRNREIGLPVELLHRITGFEGAPFECTQS